MDFEGWGMRVAVTPREYATRRSRRGVFGNRGPSGGYASGGVASLEDPGPSQVTIGGDIGQQRRSRHPQLSWRGQPPM